MTNPNRVLSLAALALVAVGALLYAGCGGSDDNSTTDEATTSTQTQSSDGGGTDGGGTPPSAEPIGPPKAKESIKDAEKRIEKAISSGDCDKINDLNPIGRKSLDTPERCEALKRRLTDAQVVGAEAYDDGGGVIDYERGALSYTAVMIVDRDGLFHIFYIDPFLGEKSADTKLAKEFDPAAKDAVDALETKDCKDFLSVVYRRIGAGAADKKAACTAAENNPIARLLERDPDAKLEGLGGNKDYAFYAIGTPVVNFTVVMARQSDENLGEGVDPLPKDAAEYAYLGAYATNIRGSLE